MDLQKTFSKIFLWMALGLAITFATGYIVSQNPNMIEKIFGNRSVLIVLSIATLALVLALSAFIKKLSPMAAKFCFIIYSFLTGLTFSGWFIMYKLDSIIFVFGITGVLFLIFALIGRFTKIDLTKLGTILFMALIGIIICSIVNIFLQNEGFDLALCIVGIVIFLLYVAYDINVIKRNMQDFEDDDRLAIYGALQLYLDFINIFIRLLRIFGSRRD